MDSSFIRPKRLGPEPEVGQISVAVIGGGIGGLAAALPMLRAGLDVHVYEQGQEMREAGAGIQISPNATCVLNRLGVAETLATVGVQPLALRQRRWDDGPTLSCAPLGDTLEAACGAPYYQISPRRSLNVLASRLPADRLHLGHRLTELIDHGPRVEGRFENGKSTSVDVLVGADGIHSAAYRIVFGDESPQFTGCVAYRGVVAAGRLRGLEPAGSLDSGAVDEVFVWGLFARPRMEHWSAGRVTLLGDACHAMLPFRAQGAAQAIEDGAVLAACLAQIGRSDIPQALRLYESAAKFRSSLEELRAKPRPKNIPREDVGGAKGRCSGPVAGP